MWPPNAIINAPLIQNAVSRKTYHNHNKLTVSSGLKLAEVKIS